MYNIAKLTETDRRVLFLNTANKMNMHPAIVEKDFWVCLILDFLFHKSPYKDAFIFKGGTSLSKAYNLIERFSEDIDLILDWRIIHYGEHEPWENRSKNQQDKLNKQMNKDAQSFLEKEFVPQIREQLNELLGFELEIYPDMEDEQTVNVMFPAIFDMIYVRPEIGLEIGPLAEWLPNHERKIVPYAAEQYGNVFQQAGTMIKTVDAERTFWEKTTILHKVANRDVTIPFPSRYARHFYDLYCMFHSDIKQSAFDKKELLEQDILFKQKFYLSNRSGYDTAKIGTMKLLPQQEDIPALKNDYIHMANMIYGNIPDFDDLMGTIGMLEKEINEL